MKLRVSAHVVRQLRCTLGTLPPEYGAFLAGCRKTGDIVDVYFDADARRSSVVYYPSLALCGMISQLLHKNDMLLCGVAHSHPAGMTCLSGGDLVYLLEILKANRGVIDRFIVPIIQSRAGGQPFSIHWYEARLRPGHDQVVITRIEPEIFDAIDATPLKANGLHCVVPQLHTDDQMFARVKDAYDLNRLALSRIVCVGTGGAARVCEDLARAGVIEHVLIDPDVYSASNVGTQAAYRSDLGRAKTEVVGERLRDINPNCAVRSIAAPLESLTDEQFARLVRRPLRRASNLSATLRHDGRETSLRCDVSFRPKTTLILGMTDSFHAQARVNRLALKFACPSVCAQIYGNGIGSELTFTHPTVTRACHRCLLHTRYDAYMGGYENDVTSAGTPLHVTSLTNALSAAIALVLLHRGSRHNRFNRFLDRIANRSLVQIGVDPDLDFPAFAELRSRSPQLVAGHPVWYRTAPKEGCPDCGGTGDLMAATALWKDRDTRASAL